MAEGRRYVVCRNEIEAEKDRAARTTLAENVNETLATSSPKFMVWS